MRRKNRTSPIKNILKTLPVVFGVMAVFYVAMLLKDVEVPTVLPVKDIKVEGEMNFVDEEAIKQTVRNNLINGYLAVDLKQVREELLQQPWIKDVSLRRQWPADISVFVDEQKPIAYWNSDGYISEVGEVFKPTLIDRDLELPQLNGPDSQHQNVLKLMNFLYKEMAALDFEVKQLRLDDRRAWELVISNENYDARDEMKKNSGHLIKVKLGRFDTKKRLQRFISILPALAAEIRTDNNHIDVIDMRYPNGFAVRMSNSKSILSKADIKNLSDTNLVTRNIKHDSVPARSYAKAQMNEA